MESRLGIDDCDLVFAGFCVVRLIQCCEVILGLFRIAISPLCVGHTPTFGSCTLAHRRAIHWSLDPDALYYDRHASVRLFTALTLCVKPRNTETTPGYNLGCKQ